MEMISIIPMKKLNNRRISQKIIKPFTNGKFLYYYILFVLFTIKSVDEVYVYCSNPDIQEFIPEDVKYLRRLELLNQDTTNMTEVLICFTKEVSADIYVITHTTAPFISNKSIEKGHRVLEAGDSETSFDTKKFQNFLWRDGVLFNYDLANILRTQSPPALYKETSEFSVYKHNVMTNLHRCIGEKPFIVEVREIETVDIDESKYLLIADAINNHIIMRRGYCKLNKINQFIHIGISCAYCCKQFEGGIAA